MAAVDAAAAAAASSGPAATVGGGGGGRAFDAVAAQGAEGGLFRACLAAIRGAHFQSNRTRALLVVAGLFTDRNVYREVIALFYAVTKELEAELDGRTATTKNDPVRRTLRELGYRFTEPYEQDLAFLYDGRGDWREQVEALALQTPAAVAYRAKIRAAGTAGTDSAVLAGAAFCLWGALVVGGGAVAMPRVQARYGAEATHLFRDVTGPGREGRRGDFVRAWDDLAAAGENPALFDAIVQSSRECMQCNNDLLSSLARNPWWLPVALSVAVAVVSTFIAILMRRWLSK